LHFSTWEWYLQTNPIHTDIMSKSICIHLSDLQQVWWLTWSRYELNFDWLRKLESPNYMKLGEMLLRSILCEQSYPLWWIWVYSGCCEQKWKHMGLVPSGIISLRIPINI
jgi:hypothetical protein